MDTEFKNSIKKARTAFMKNPFYSSIYQRATDNAKSYLDLMFLYSYPYEDEGEGHSFDEFRSNITLLEEGMTNEDWDCILTSFEYCGISNMLIARRADAVEVALQGEPTGTVDDPVDFEFPILNINYGMKPVVNGIVTDEDNGLLETKKITEDDILSAVYEYIGKPKVDDTGSVVVGEDGEVKFDGGNEYWRNLFIAAPVGAQMRLSLSFYFSENAKNEDGTPNQNFPLIEYRASRKGIEDEMTEEDLTYLIANEDNEKAKEHFKEILRQKTGVAVDS